MLWSYVAGSIRGSFSEHGEDVFIQERLGKKNAGFYVDIGASHPFRISNTFYFTGDRSWYNRLSLSPSFAASMADGVPKTSLSKRQ